MRLSTTARVAALVWLAAACAVLWVPLAAGETAIFLSLKEFYNYFEIDIEYLSGRVGEEVALEMTGSRNYKNGCTNLGPSPRFKVVPETSTVY